VAIEIIVLSGATHRPSKTTTLLQALASECKKNPEEGFNVSTFDLLDVGFDFGAAINRDELSSKARAIIDAVEIADGLIVGSPVYKGAYSGLFKHFFDFVDPLALLRKPVCLAACGGGHRHALVVEQFLRPLFGFFGALTVPTSVYAADSDFHQYRLCESGVTERVAQAAFEFTHLVRSQF
jgi:FMN reductase